MNYGYVMGGRYSDFENGKQVWEISDTHDEADFFGKINKLNTN